MNTRQACRIQAVVTDIEGTTSSIDFVHQVLFPYAREHLREFVLQHAENGEVRHWLDETAREAGLDGRDDEAIIATLLAWIASDRKATPLKALQGMIWQQGYQRGNYRAHVYPEVAACLRAWREVGMRLYVYSSGSVQAQKLFFRHSEAGDLGGLFLGHFDTRTGAKREAASYAAIAKAIELAPDHILFLSDIGEELDAAAATGMHTIRLCRPPMAFPDDVSHPCVRDFAEIRFD